MNKRIKQLWEDSDEIKVRYPEQGSPVSVSEQTLEKFAELIVRRCAAQIAEAIPDTDCSASGAYKTAKIAAMAKVKDHFGVEE